MYYYKTVYNDNTWDIIKSKSAIRNPLQVCRTCRLVKIISVWEYYWLAFIGWIKYGI